MGHETFMVWETDPELWLMRQKEMRKKGAQTWHIYDRWAEKYDSHTDVNDPFKDDLDYYDDY